MLAGPTDPPRLIKFGKCSVAKRSLWTNWSLSLLVDGHWGRWLASTTNIQKADLVLFRSIPTGRYKSTRQEIQKTSRLAHTWIGKADVTLKNYPNAASLNNNKQQNEKAKTLNWNRPRTTRFAVDLIGMTAVPDSLGIQRKSQILRSMLHNLKVKPKFISQLLHTP